MERAPLQADTIAEHQPAILSNAHNLAPSHDCFDSLSPVVSVLICGTDQPSQSFDRRHPLDQAEGEF